MSFESRGLPPWQGRPEQVQRLSPEAPPSFIFLAKQSESLGGTPCGLGSQVLENLPVFRLRKKRQRDESFAGNSPGIRPSASSGAHLAVALTDDAGLAQTAFSRCALSRPSLADRLSRPDGRSVLKPHGECGQGKQVRPSVEKRTCGLGWSFGRRLGGLGSQRSRASGNARCVIGGALVGGFPG